MDSQQKVILDSIAKTPSETKSFLDTADSDKTVIDVTATDEDQLVEVDIRLEKLELLTAQAVTLAKKVANQMDELKKHAEAIESDEDRSMALTVHDTQVAEALELLTRVKDKAKQYTNEKKRLSEYKTTIEDRIKKATTPPQPTAPRMSLRDMPELEELFALPTFDGDIVNFPTFWEPFESSVDCASIPDIQKLTVLMGSLVGAARSAVDGYSITSQNYEIVKDVLKRRFGDKQWLLRSLMTQLVKLPPAQSSVKSVRQTFEQIQRICRILQSQGIDVENDQVLITIESKIPKWLLREVYNLKLSLREKYDVATLLEIIEMKLKLSEDVDDASGSMNTQQHRAKGPDNKKPGKGTNKQYSNLPSAFTVTHENKKKIEKRCKFCQQTHWTTDCTVYPDVEALC